MVSQMSSEVGRASRKKNREKPEPYRGWDKGQPGRGRKFFGSDPEDGNGGGILRQVSAARWGSPALRRSSQTELSSWKVGSAGPAPDVGSHGAASRMTSMMRPRAVRCLWLEKVSR